MIEAKCQCGATLDVPESLVGRPAACGACDATLHFIAAELLADGGGGGDFDAKLVVLSGPDRVGEQLLLGGVVDITLGKAPQRTIQLGAGRMVSRAHARLTRLDFGPSRWRIEDTNSTNGLLVNGQRIASHELRHGDLIRVGDYELKYVSTSAIGALPQPPPPGGDVGGETCPSCRQSLPPGSKICVGCGIDIKTGRPLVLSKGLDEDDLAIRADTWIRIVSWVIPFGLFPIASEAFGTRKPITTWVITILTILASLAFMVAVMADDEDDPSIGLLNLMQWVGDPSLSNPDLEPWESWPEGVGFRWWQLLTHALLHDPSFIGLWFHLAGNLLFLWVFGMRVNEMLGNAKFAVVYPLLAIGSAVVDLLVNADQPMYPTVGASGAVMGLAGMYLVFFPVQRVHLAVWARWWLLFFPAIFWAGFKCSYRVFSMRGFWLLVLWIAWNDVLPVLVGWNDQVSHWAHLGGFVTGAALALLLLITRQANAHRGDLLSVVLGRHAWALLGRPAPKALPSGAT